MGSEPDALASRIVSSATGRNFFLQFLFFQNGCFLAVSEGDSRLGAMSIAISSAGNVNAAKVIPSKYDSIFINTVAEKVSSMINGICLVSLHSKGELGLDDMKAIMGEVMTLVGSRKHED
jgi:hypothetical protein